MGQFLLNLSDVDEMIIRNYAQSQRKDPSHLIRSMVINRIEDEIDLDRFEELIIQHRENPSTMTLEEMKEAFNIKK